MEKRWFTVQESASYLSVTVYCIREQIWAGRLPYVRAGKRFVLDKLDLDSWAEAGKQLEPVFHNGTKTGRRRGEARINPIKTRSYCGAEDK